MEEIFNFCFAVKRKPIVFQADPSGDGFGRGPACGARQPDEHDDGGQPDVRAHCHP